MSLAFAIVLSVAMICVTILVITVVGVNLSKRSRTCPHCGKPN
jgi:hypothetical protein